jgi:hypothetical protein
VAVDPSDADRFAAAAAAAGTPARRAGLVGGDRLVVSGHIDLPIERLTESARLGAA